MCPKCYDSMTFSSKNANRIIEGVNEGVNGGVNVFSCGMYEKTLQKLIRGLKYHKQKELAYYLAKFMYEYWSELGDTRDFQVVPTPLHKNRIKKRKYNHMDLVAEEFCKLTGYSLNKDLIKRVKDTKPQYKLTRPQRLENLNGAFEVDKSEDLGKPILILDDICTTGATFEEMIKALRKADLKEIVCLASSSP